MHDPKEVLAVCEKAPDGPYHVGGAEGSMPHSHSTQLTGHRPDGNHYVMAQANYNFKEESEALINFIALARTVLPQLAEDYRKLAGYALQVEKALDLLLDNLFEMDDETCPADVDGEHFCCDINICGVERPYKECWLKFYLDKAKAGEDAGYGGGE